MGDPRETAKFIGVTDVSRKLVCVGNPAMPEATSPYMLVDGVPHDKQDGRRVVLTPAHMTIFTSGRRPRKLERTRYGTVPPGTAVWRRRVRI